MTTLDIQHIVFKIGGKIVDRSQYRKPFPEDDYQENKILLEERERQAPIIKRRLLRREYFKRKYQGDNEFRQRVLERGRQYSKRRNAPISPSRFPIPDENELEEIL